MSALLCVSLTCCLAFALEKALRRKDGVSIGSLLGSFHCLSMRELARPGGGGGGEGEESVTVGERVFCTAGHRGGGKGSKTVRRDIRGISNSDRTK